MWMRAQSVFVNWEASELCVEENLMFLCVCVGGRSSGFDVHVTAKLSYSVIAVRALVLIDEMHDGLIFQKQK